MHELGKIVDKAVKGEIKVQLGLVYTDIKQLREETRAVKQKYFEAMKRIRALEEAIRELREKDKGTDFGM